MENFNTNQVALAASEFQRRRTGHTNQSGSVVLTGDTLVVTLPENLSPVEKDLPETSGGAAQVREFYRQFLAEACKPRRKEIKNITRVEVRQATAEVETRSGTVFRIFPSDTTVQVFLLADSVIDGDGRGQ